MFLNDKTRVFFKRFLNILLFAVAGYIVIYYIYVHFWRTEEYKPVEKATIAGILNAEQAVNSDQKQKVLGHFEQKNNGENSVSVEDRTRISNLLH